MGRKSCAPSPTSRIMPDAINKFKENRNIAQVRAIQRDIHALYRIDASQYDNERKLGIRKIYDMVPSNMENKKKRIIVKNIEDTKSHKQTTIYKLGVKK